ncbi:MAG TPA: ABC transporter ATP-binding protein [Acidimicrobiia bacterium]|nr:ABC transporter ATP-binding protein [Acidimicrobiia bacterium]
MSLPVGDRPLVLSASGVTVRFGGLTALDAVDLQVPVGTTVGLVGPNGAGKTTLFNVISGLLRPDGGSVHLNARDITRLRPVARARQGIARTYQRSELFTELTVRQNLQLAYRARSRTHHLAFDLLGIGSRRDSEEDRVVDELLTSLDLDAMAASPTASLPLGTGRLVEVGRALAATPEIVLLDEPSAGLDEHETDRLAEALRRARAASTVAFLLVEHDVDFVLGLSERVSVLDFGRLIAVGDPDSIRADPTVRAAYLGTEIES